MLTDDIRALLDHKTDAELGDVFDGLILDDRRSRRWRLANTAHLRAWGEVPRRLEESKVQVLHEIGPAAALARGLVTRADLVTLLGNPAQLESFQDHALSEDTYFFRKLEAELLQRRRDFRRAARAARSDGSWAHFGGEVERRCSQAQAWALAKVFFGLGALDAGREAEFRRRVAEAHERLCVAFGGDGTRPHGALEAGRGLAAAVQALDGSVTVAKGALERLAAGTTVQITAAASLLSALAAASERLRGLVPPVDRSVRFPLLTTHRGGAVFEVEVSRSPSPFGRWVLSPEVQTLGATRLDRDFRASLELALRHAVQFTQFASRGEKGPFWFRWSLHGSRGVPALTGGSAGGVFAAALLALIDDAEMDPSAGFTASLEEDPVSGTVRLGSVEGIEDKVEAAVLRKSPPIRTFVLSPADHRDHADALRRRFPGIVVYAATTPYEALRLLSPERTAVLEFLRRLAEEERGLGPRHVRFLPQAAATGRPSKFLLPPRVEDVTEGKRGGEEAEAPEELGRFFDERLRDGKRSAGALSLDGVLAGFHCPSTELHHLIVIGEPGTGKSTLLWRQFTRHAQAVLAALERGELSHHDAALLVPLAYPLRSLPEPQEDSGAAPDLKRLALDYVLKLAYQDADLRDEGAPTRRDAVRKWLVDKLQQNHCVLYLDAHDELRPRPAGGGGSDRAQVLREALAGVRDVHVLVTTRPTGAEGRIGLADPRRFRVAPLEWGDVELYVERSFPGGRAPLGQELLETLRRTPGPKGLVSVPLFLALIVLAADSGEGVTLDDPGPRTALLRHCLEAFLRRAIEEERVRPKVEKQALEGVNLRREVYGPIIDALSRLAREHYDSGPLALASDEDRKDEVEVALNAAAGPQLRQILGEGVELVQALFEFGLLVPGPGGKGMDIVLRTIHEYLAGRWMAKTREELAAEELQQEGWENVWPFVVGEFDDPGRQKRLLEGLHGQCRALDPERRAAHLCVLARACAEAKREAKAAIEEEVVKELAANVSRGTEREACLAALAENASEPAVGALIGFATQPVGEVWDRYEVRAQALAALEGSGNSEVSGALRGVVASAAETYDFRERSAASLGARGLGADFEAPADLAGDRHFTRALAVLRREAPLFDATDLDAAALGRMAQDRAYRRIDDWVRRDGRRLAQYEHRETGVVFVLLPAGEFLMGSPPDDPEAWTDETQHPVRVRPLLMARYALAESVYEAWLGPGGEARVGTFVDDSEQGKSTPKTDVDWNEARASCARFGWTLPTEAQWEYACRAGTTTRYAFGEELGPEDANFSGSGMAGVCPVREYRPNDFGLFQMHGNVWEWCHDVCSPTFYVREEAKGPDPLCLAGSGIRVLRGGSWVNHARYCRSAYRGRVAAADRGGNAGFRPAGLLAP
jgi:formylglycine-generating enzyme required for sulfatase activity